MFTQILVLFLFLTNLSNLKTESPVSTTKTDEKGLIWQENRRLTWDDFKSEADGKDPLHAMTSTNLDVRANCYGNTLRYEVKCVFVTNDSWTKNKQSQRLLAHEQLHFDLSEVHARLLRKKLSLLNDFCGSKRTGLDKVVDQAFADWKKEQDVYDHESKHGLNREKQKEWEDAIGQRLNALAAYSYKEPAIQ
ncbi:DUF922 domain-containing protein [Adhaeribacter aquaticus]|uniref:DUF922 domain-containing protein n=1 Tax=Adhaeribacter aquaticus TaxID=299567 RepID=UPI00041B0407|nr:DUF922 domain-containing protein [Adhaeribacter aquaticus]